MLQIVLDVQRTLCHGDHLRQEIMKSSNSLYLLIFELNVTLTLLVMVIICAIPFKNLVFKSRNENVDFLTLKCDLDLRGSDQIVALCTLAHHGDYSCQVILKTYQGFKSYGADKKCRLFNI